MGLLTGPFALGRDCYGKDSEGRSAWAWDAGECDRILASDLLAREFKLPIFLGFFDVGAGQRQHERFCLVQWPFEDDQVLGALVWRQRYIFELIEEMDPQI